MIEISQFLANKESKYAVVLASRWAIDPVAQTISNAPRLFNINGVEYAILSLQPNEIPLLHAYTAQLNEQIEFGFKQGSGAIKLLCHSQAVELLAKIDSTDAK